ncbi:histone H2A.Z-specific chaperone chz1-like [Macadamia integrifolia]|uniref:histone H2A.Z-specific chaperone chz1-like n=1 Tax=Macadamia integrifolia TaxID=60698 RepID=UPI001C4F46FD|nr:histone H2A.Z-specific chaperone chz1-like [Macadamia integrifolia]
MPVTAATLGSLELATLVGDKFMGEPRNETLEGAPLKRKPDLELFDEGEDRKKIKPEVSGNDPPLIEEKSGKDESEEDGESDEDDEGDDYDEDDEAVDEDGEHSHGKSVIDAKGKGIMDEEDKGKGKNLKVENGSDDESADDRDLSDEDSDLSDDPLAEVDLDNILPSRTRRRVSQPGAYLVNDLEDDDDSDDSDV